MPAIRLNPLDASWLYTESRATPMHVGALLPFALPAGAPKDFGRRLMAELKTHQHVAPPWNRRLKSSLLKMPLHYWVDDDEIDLEAHLRHAALPHPGGERELGELIARLHSQPLDLSRPPWECTLIEGLDHGRFAFFVKMHHSLIDGISGMRLLERAMPQDAEKSLTVPPFWAVAPARKSAKPADAEVASRDTRSATFANAAATSEKCHQTDLLANFVRSGVEGRPEVVGPSRMTRLIRLESPESIATVTNLAPVYR